MATRADRTPLAISLAFTDSDRDLIYSVGRNIITCICPDNRWKILLHVHVSKGVMTQTDIQQHLVYYYNTCILKCIVLNLKFKLNNLGLNSKFKIHILYLCPRGNGNGHYTSWCSSQRHIDSNDGRYGMEWHRSVGLGYKTQTTISHRKLSIT